MGKALTTAALTLLLAAPSATGAAHVAERTPWSETYPELTELVPQADPQGWRIAEYRLSRREAQSLERALGFDLEPEDLIPQFYAAHDERGQLVGVAMFVEPHAGARSHAAFHVGVAVDPRGRVAAVSVHDPALRDLAQPEFLDQLRGRTLASRFDVGRGDLRAVEGRDVESQHVANAAREALLFMQLALGRNS